MKQSIEITEEFNHWASFIADKIRTARIKASFKVNEEILQLYWEIGASILEHQKKKGWGAKIIDLLAKDISKHFPDSKGFSVRNLKYMRAFAKAYPDFPIVQVPLASNGNEIVQVPLAQITWYHHIGLLTKIDDSLERAFYIIETAKNQWSRNVMMLQIESDYYNRKGKIISNFEKTLPAYQSDLAQGMFKDPYHLSFLSISDKIREKELEQKLINKISDFLLELGKGFAFVGRQYKITIDNTEYNIDLLFYHTQLHCYVVIELKTGEFKPEYISKINFYISAIDDILKSSADEPTIGLLLCAGKSKVKVEYAMRGLERPLGVASYQLEKVVRDNMEKLDIDTK